MATRAKPGHREYRLTTELLPQQQEFVHRFFMTGNVTQSAKDAGYSKKSAGNIGQGLLKNPKIQCAIEQLRIDRDITEGNEKPWMIQELKIMYRMAIKKKELAVAFKCMDKLSDIYEVTKPKDGGSPGANGGKKKPGDINLEDYSDEELRSFLKRADERLAHKDTPEQS